MKKIISHYFTKEKHIKFHIVSGKSLFLHNNHNRLITIHKNVAIDYDKRRRKI